MHPCRHLHLLLLPGDAPKLRCRQCHLVIKTAELTDSYCPECYELHGRKISDFEEVRSQESSKTRYCCEDCGVLIDVD